MGFQHALFRRMLPDQMSIIGDSSQQTTDTVAASGSPGERTASPPDLNATPSRVEVLVGWWRLAWPHIRRHGNACLCCAIVLMVVLYALGETLLVNVKDTAAPATRALLAKSTVDTALDVAQKQATQRLRLETRLAMVLTFGFCLPLGVMLELCTRRFGFSLRVAPLLVAGAVALWLWLQAVFVNLAAAPRTTKGLQALYIWFTDALGASMAARWFDCLMGGFIGLIVFSTYWLPLVLPKPRRF